MSSFVAPHTFSPKTAWMCFRLNFRRFDPGFLCSPLSMYHPSCSGHFASIPRLIRSAVFVLLLPLVAFAARPCFGRRVRVVVDAEGRPHAELRELVVDQPPDR